MLHAGQQRGGHLGIGQRPVGALGAGQAQVLHQRPQLVRGGIGVQAARQQHRAGKGLWRGHIGELQLGLPELAVKRCVVRHHGRLAHKARRIAHHGVCTGRILKHGVADARQLGDEGRNPRPGFHQALKTVHHLAALQQHDGHLGRPRALAGRHAGGFKVDDSNGGHGGKAGKRKGLAPRVQRPAFRPAGGVHRGAVRLLWARRLRASPVPCAHPGCAVVRR